MKLFLRAFCFVLYFLCFLTADALGQLPQNKIFTRKNLLYSNYNASLDPLSLGNSSNCYFDPITPPYLKEDFLINSYDGDYGCQQWDVRPGSDGEGYSLFAWLDNRNGEKQIFVQFYDPEGNRIGNNSVINEQRINGNNSPAVSANKTGIFVVVWLRDFSTVMAQKFNRYGVKIGNNIIVAQNSSFNTAEPGVAVNNDSSFVVTWASDQPASGYLVYSCFVNGSGVPGNGQVVNDELNTVSSISLERNIGVDSSGNYFICWSSYGGFAQSRIFLQRLNGTGVKIGNNIKLSDEIDRADQIFPQIVTSPGGFSLIVWEERHKGVRGKISSPNNFVTPEIILSDNTGWTGYSASLAGDSAFLCSIGPVFQLIGLSGGLIGDTVSIKINSSLSPDFSFREHTFKKQNFIFAATLSDRSDLNVYFQEFNSNLAPVRSFEKINDDVLSSDQRTPFVKFNKRGEVLVLWEDGRDGRFDLFAQLFDTSFNPIGNNIRINDVNTERWFLGQMTAESLSDGTFIILFSEGDLDGGIYVQTLSPNGEKIGLNKQVYEYANQSDLKLNINSKDEIEVCWFNTQGVWLKRYDKEMRLIFGEKQILNTAHYFRVTASVDTGLNIFTAWITYNNNAIDTLIYGAFYNKNGALVKSEFVIDTLDYPSYLMCANNDTDYVLIYSKGSVNFILRSYLSSGLQMKDTIYTFSNPPIVKFKNEKLLILYNPGYDVVGLYFDDRNDSSQCYELHQYNELIPFLFADVNRQIVSADIKDEKLFLAWQDYLNPGKGFDISGNVRHLNNVIFEGEKDDLFQYQYYLYDNYPNPFNNGTIIKYSLPRESKVKIQIFDLLGQLCGDLVDELQTEGVYDIYFDAGKLASGIYIFSFMAKGSDGAEPFHAAKKMVLLK